MSGRSQCFPLNRLVFSRESTLGAITIRYLHRLSLTALGDNDHKILQEPPHNGLLNFPFPQTITTAAAAQTQENFSGARHYGPVLLGRNYFLCPVQVGKGTPTLSEKKQPVSAPCHKRLRLGNGFCGSSVHITNPAAAAWFGCGTRSRGRLRQPAAVMGYAKDWQVGRATEDTGANDLHLPGRLNEIITKIE
ncbi:hypothetical protein CEXT_161801 [Caerostris extrusa]|uniref:Uncharacterized protein n=1 Tax=Caerostris extrusa TaxID=172846 RepID=A0AAV4VTW5_CAEEX|nr:hypothetical protein CEXT_161801 [Caerostris extrusa]